MVCMVTGQCWEVVRWCVIPDYNHVLHVGNLAPFQKSGNRDPDWNELESGITEVESHNIPNSRLKN
ncbi:hypothetical protein E2C01_084689 [Portunus trituberculatus]|uniref:Uncharacterized protein n=1 Tax=Portunus trituberculatus TaxID=210409 RepID=A0A5B7IYY7_PORTR|nr:hypothetical protein [Portunus trituberculatus]